MIGAYQKTISVFTPLSFTGNRYIEAAWETLQAQTYQDFEWVVLENHGGKLPRHIRNDPRVKCSTNLQLKGIGALKRATCKLASGEILFELDHDDLLHETALEKAHEAIITRGADFAYSDTAEFFDESWAPNVYRIDCGWTSYPVTFQGHELLAQPQPPPTPQNLRKVEWSPNHFRAFKTESYWKVGGHDASLEVADDHDLIVRMYLAGMRFEHVPECLYFYRIHSQQTTNASQKNALIQEIDWQVYDRHITPLADRFADSNQLRKIDLCGGIDPRSGYEPFDLRLGHDLNDRWPLEDNTVGVIRAMDALEHLRSPIHTMNEAHRVLAPGGFLLVEVPSTDGRGAFQDPTHVSFWNPNSFWYYTREQQRRYVSGVTARFQVSRIRQFHPSRWHEEHQIPYVQAHLIALKDGYEPMGLVEV
jgi:O-antigen biosynthesis protein